ncbi:MAG: hypothetical protein H0V81_13970, partial [Solirubrobacterales bacterium]|nr:hypothetical protein [Solirubrobacterales bacterium]
RRPALAGRPASPAAELASLAAVGFTDSAYAQATTHALITAGAGPGARLAAATRTVRTTSDALERLITSIYGDDLGGRFGQAWASQSEAFADYARAKTEQNGLSTQQALNALERLSREIAVLVDEGDPGGSRRETVLALRAYQDATTAAIRAQATGSPRFAERILEAARRARGVGRALAVRVARQMPEKFPAA